MKAPLFCLLLAASASAGEMINSPAPSKAVWKETPVPKLPAGVHPKDPEDPDRILEKVLVSEVDVDGDRKNDLIVNTGRGGTGGPYLLIYRREGKGFRQVLMAQGGLVVSPERGRVEIWSRAGGMQERRTVYRFDGNRFSEVFTELLAGPDEHDRYEVVSRTTPGAKP